jgi:tetratricopeptide (TPR) repeat protein
MASGYNLLGDELGMVSTESLNDLPGALAAYRRYIGLMNQALRIDSDLLRAKQGIARGQLKIGETEEEIDPVQALKDLQLGTELLASLPREKQGDLKIVRLREDLLQEEAIDLAQLGDYAKANALMAGIDQLHEKLVAADPHDLRALLDREIDLNDWTSILEIEADPALGATASDQRQILAAAEKLSLQQIAVLDTMLKLNRSQEEMESVRADTQALLGSIQFRLRHEENSVELVKKGLAVFRVLVKKNWNSPSILIAAAHDFLSAEPRSLRDPQLAVSCAEQAVILTHRKLPSNLLTLAQAYRATGQAEKSRAAAKEGLALLPATQPGSAKPRIRKLLEIQAQNSR